jgi:predicted DNA-binding protein with PD1-like motif
VASMTAIGAFSGASLGYFDIEKKEYEKILVGEQVEVLSLIGDIALNGGEPELHAHVVRGRRDGTTKGGHLLEAHPGGGPGGVAGPSAKEDRREDRPRAHRLKGWLDHL